MRSQIRENMQYFYERVCAGVFFHTMFRKLWRVKKTPGTWQTRGYLTYCFFWKKKEKEDGLEHVES